MLKDGKQCELTREEALRLHREMWADMQTELGDEPNPDARAAHKWNWLKRHGYKDVEAHCFLCEYALQAWYRSDAHSSCDCCPIDWSPLRVLGWRGVGKCFEIYKGGGAIYRCAPISEILALPERE